MQVKKCQVVPFECVVRGYLEGSGWREYQQSGKVCGVALPSGLQQCERLPEPIFTPATKAEEGHDINVTFAEMAGAIGAELAEQLRRRSLEVYGQAVQYAADRGIIIADTKLEWGLHEGEVLLVDEVLTPDSSRFWPAKDFQPGKPQSSWDKQYVREWLMSTPWDRESPPPRLPDRVVERTAEKYLSVYRLLTGHDLKVS